MQLTNAMDYNDRGSKRHFQEKIDLKGGAKFLDLLVEKRDGFFLCISHSRMKLTYIHSTTRIFYYT